MRLQVGDIEVEVVYKDIKNLYLRVLPPDGRVVVSAPRRVGGATIANFVTAKLGWIRRKQRAMQEQRLREQREGASGETLYVWGRRCRLTVVEGARYGMEVDGADALFTVRDGSTPEQRSAWLREWQREQLCEALERVLPVWEERTGLYPAQWRTKYMKTRWGTCNTRARRVWFNVRLAEYPPECLEYVVLHELAHLREPSHNADFKAILDAHMPNWRSVRRMLDDQAQGRLG